MLVKKYFDGDCVGYEEVPDPEPIVEAEVVAETNVEETENVEELDSGSN